MGAGHSHGHGHSHGGSGTASAAHRGRLMTALGITLLVLATEVVGSALTGSLALLADAGHMATDAAGIAMALLAIRIACRPPSERRTFGYARAEILALFDGLTLVEPELVHLQDWRPDPEDGPIPLHPHPQICAVARKR